MKKVLALLLVAIISVSAFGMTAYAYTGHVNAGDTLTFNGATSNNAFGDLIKWTGVVFGNAENIIDLEGTLAVGGSFNSNRGLSVNGGAYGANPADTDDVCRMLLNREQQTVNIPLPILRNSLLTLRAQPIPLKRLLIRSRRTVNVRKLTAHIHLKATPTLIHSYTT